MSSAFTETETRARLAVDGGGAGQTDGEGHDDTRRTDGKFDTAAESVV